MHNRCKTLSLFAVAIAVVVGSSAIAKDGPFIPLNEFDPDFQWFKPFELREYGGPHPPNTGWFFTFDRMYVNVSRSEQQNNSGQGDFTWGNRLDMGFMKEDQKGWMMSVMHIDGPNLPTQNNANLTNVELNRVWRLDPFHKGSHMELFIGGRFRQFTDRTFNYVENNMVGGQLGVRWFKQTDHWLLSSEMRFAASNNYQLLGQNNAEAFVPMGELRVQAAYYVTRDLAVRFGLHTMYFGQGINRVALTTLNDEDLLVAGISFGFVYQR